MSCTLFIDWYFRNDLGSMVSSAPLGNITALSARSEDTEADDPRERENVGAVAGVGGGVGKGWFWRGAIAGTIIGGNTGFCLTVELLRSSTMRRTSGMTASRSLRLMNKCKASTISDSSARRL